MIEFYIKRLFAHKFLLSFLPSPVSIQIANRKKTERENFS